MRPGKHHFAIGLRGATDSSGLMNVSTQARRIDLNLEAGHTYLAISVSSPDPLHPGWGIAIVDNNKIIYDDRAWIKH